MNLQNNISTSQQVHSFPLILIGQIFSSIYPFIHIFMVNLLFSSEPLAKHLYCVLVTTLFLKGFHAALFPFLALSIIFAATAYTVECTINIFHTTQLTRFVVLHHVHILYQTRNLFLLLPNPLRNPYVRKSIAGFTRVRVV